MEAIDLNILKDLLIIRDLFTNNVEITDVKISQKQNWGDILLFTYKNERLFVPCIFDNERKIIETYKYSDEYSCYSYTESIDLIDSWSNWTQEIVDELHSEA